MRYYYPCFVLLLLLGSVSTAHAQVIYNWQTAASGNFNLAGNWTPGGGPPTTLDTAIVDAIGSSYTVTLNSARSLANLTIDSANATLLQSTNLTTSGFVTLNAGSYTLNNATFTGGTLVAAAGLRYTPLGNTTVNLVNVTLGTANADVIATNVGGANYNFSGTSDFQTGFIPTISNGSFISYQTTRTLNSGFILNNATLRSTTAASTITLDVGNTITSRNGNDRISGAGNWANSGTVQTDLVATLPTLTLDSNISTWTNHATGVLLAQSNTSTGSINLNVTTLINNGVLRANANGIITIQTNLTTAQLGAWDTTGGGRVSLNSTLNNTAAILDITDARGTLYTTGSATINNGTIQANGTARLYTIGNNTLNLANVTLGTANPDVLQLNSAGTYVMSGSTDFQIGFTPSLINQTFVSYATTRTLNTGFNLSTGNLRSSTAGSTITLDTGKSIIATAGINTMAGLGNWVNNGSIQTNGNATLSISNSGSLINNGIIAATSTSSITISSGSLTLNSGSQLLTLGTGTISISTSTVTNNGAINLASGSTLSIGGGTGTLTNNSTLLTVNGILSANLIVSSGASVQGNGSISRSVTIQSGGILDPGASPGSITVNTGITIQNQGEFRWDLNGHTVSGSGINYDVVKVTSGNTVIAAGAVLRLNLPGGATFTNPFWGQNELWTIVDNLGTGTLTGNFTTPNIIGGIQPNGFFDTFAGGSNANDLILRWNYVAVPEPMTWVLIILGVGSLLACTYRGWRQQCRQLNQLAEELVEE